MSATVETAASPWAARTQRAAELRERHGFAAELLTLYGALAPVQEDVWRSVRDGAAPPAGLARWAAVRVLPAVVEATAAAGPPRLAESVVERFADDSIDDALAGWLAGEELDPVDRYLARASLAPALEALGEEAGAACAPEEGDGALLCPICGGRPQLSVLADSGDALVTGRRSLLCSRCSSSWEHSRSVCPACGEADESRLLLYAERWTGPVTAAGGEDAPEPVFPHVRIAGCDTCRRYLLEVDLGREARAVPEVDELAALPLDLYAADLGLTKVTSNLMGF